MKYLILFITLFLSSMLFISCSDLKDNIPLTTDINIHGNEVFDTTASNYHGKQVLDSQNSFQDCKQCHDANYSGGITKVSCYSSDCHVSPAINVHEIGITDVQSPNFHGKFIADNFSGSMNSCAQCHGDSFQGGVVSPTCTNCHATIPVHVDGIVNPGSPNFHGKYIAANLAWDMRACGSCHSADYSGGIASQSCLGCHTQENGPEACNTCHGDFNDPSKIAPPRSLSGATLPSERGVGAHTKHLTENVLGKAVECTQCHTIPNGFSDPVHIDNTPGAQLVFGDLANLSTNVPDGFNYQSSLGDFNPNPSFDFASGTCANTYCHGYFKNGNLDNVVSFTAESDGAACGTCHGDPATGNPLPLTTNQGGTHPPNQNCDLVYCHGDVVAIDNNAAQIYTIIDKNKHMNGKLNWSGTELTY